MTTHKHYGTRGDSGRRRQAGASTLTSSLPSPLANDDEGDLAGTREHVSQSGDAAVLTSVRGMARLLQATLDVWLTTPGISAERAEFLNDNVKPAIDALWRVR